MNYTQWAEKGRREVISYNMEYGVGSGVRWGEVGGFLGVMCEPKQLSLKGKTSHTVGPTRKRKERRQADRGRERQSGRKTKAPFAKFQSKSFTLLTSPK